MQFWDALDYIGFEPYFPVTFKNDPTVAELKAGFAAAMDSLSLAKQLSERYGKPVVFTEYAPLAYDGANRDQQNRPAALKGRRAGADRPVRGDLPGDRGTPLDRRHVPLGVVPPQAGRRPGMAAR